MPTFPQRIAQFFSALGDRIAGRSRGARGPEQSRIADARGVGGITTSGYQRTPDERTAEWLRAAGATQLWGKPPRLRISGGQHQAGTCRMGNDPMTSVVDKDCRIHDVDNVYVIDASVHPTNGGFNPVLTILANAYRASSVMLNAWRGSKVS